jgi:hypothetical protein
MSIHKSLEALAQSLIDKANAPETKMEVKEQVDIFKATSAWYLGMRKAAKNEPDEPGEGGTFEDLREKVNGKGHTL